MIARGYDHAGWHATGRLEWSLTVAGRSGADRPGYFPGSPGHGAARDSRCPRPVRRDRRARAVFRSSRRRADRRVRSGADVAHVSTSAHPGDLSRVWALIKATRGDPLAPFAMQAGKCYLFSADGTAALAYRTRIGYAVVSGDPVGDEAQFPQLVADFANMCHTHGWRIVVLACSERRLHLWNDPKVLGQSLRAVPIGRDVVIDVSSFEMVGRKFRNVRQAVKRTHNCGITTEIVAEQELDGRRRAELTEVLRASSSGAHTDRGFCMNLDGVLEGRYPGIQLIVARDSPGEYRAFTATPPPAAVAISRLDVPWRRRGAPNGIDERLSVDMINAAKDAGAQRVSLGIRGLPGDLRREAARTGAKPVLLADPSAGSVDRARVAVSIPAQIPLAGRAAVCAGVADSAGCR